MAWVHRAGLGAFLVEYSDLPKANHSPSLALWPRLTLGLSPSAALVLAAECAVFLGALAVGRNVGMAAPLFVALALARCRYQTMEAPSVRLLQLVGIVSGGLRSVPISVPADRRGDSVRLNRVRGLHASLGDGRVLRCAMPALAEFRPDRRCFPALEQVRR